MPIWQSEKESGPVATEPMDTYIFHFKRRGVHSLRTCQIRAHRHSEMLASFIPD